MFQQMCEECGLDLHGAPLRDDWDPDDPHVVEKMRSWLVRLRQTALHPEVGARNRRALGHKEGSLRTVDEVLEAMLDQSEISLRADQRALLLAKLRRGQTFENSPQVQQALEIWTEVLQEAGTMVLECRGQLAREIETTGANGKTMDGNEGEEDLSEGEAQGSTDYANNSPEATSRIGTFRNRLRAALEIEHMALFFRANAHFQIKSNPDMTDPDSQAFRDLEHLETEGYELAKKLRQEILKEVINMQDCFILIKSTNPSILNRPLRKSTDL
jgi:E3 ubiquitin-protein ligase SHPRH